MNQQYDYVSQNRTSILSRFNNLLIPVTESGCWLWIGTTNWRGYGQFKLKRSAMQAHRVSYQLFIGPITEAYTIDHLCRVRCCVNPDHLEAVPHFVNLLRGNTVNAIAASKTHCPQGHPYSGDNLIIRKERRRVCRACKNAINRKRVIQ